MPHQGPNISRLVTFAPLVVQLLVSTAPAPTSKSSGTFDAFEEKDSHNPMDFFPQREINSLPPEHLAIWREILAWLIKYLIRLKGAPWMHRDGTPFFPAAFAAMAAENHQTPAHAVVRACSEWIKILIELRPFQEVLVTGHPTALKFFHHTLCELEIAAEASAFQRSLPAHEEIFVFARALSCYLAAAVDPAKPDDVPAYSHFRSIWPDVAARTLPSLPMLPDDQPFDHIKSLQVKPEDSEAPADLGALHPDIRAIVLFAPHFVKLVAEMPVAYFEAGDATVAFPPEEAIRDLPQAGSLRATWTDLGRLLRLTEPPFLCSNLFKIYVSPTQDDSPSVLALTSNILGLCQKTLRIIPRELRSRRDAGVAVVGVVNRLERIAAEETDVQGTPPAGFYEAPASTMYRICVLALASFYASMLVRGTTRATLTDQFAAGWPRVFLRRSQALHMLHPSKFYAVERLASFQQQPGDNARLGRFSPRRRASFSPRVLQ